MARITTEAPSLRNYNFLLLSVAGLGGLLYGVDVGIIGGALPYLEATSHLSAEQLSAIVAAVLLGSIFSTIFAGLLADWIGRKPVMILSGIVFVISIPLIALSQSYGSLLFGRLLQGASGGFVGVVVPLYLAECLISRHRGRGTAMFQWLLTLGIVAAALIGMYYSYHVKAVAAVSDAATVFRVKEQAWRHIFWVSLPPGILFTLGAFFVSESPRWLFRRGKRESAMTALLRSRAPEAAQLEFSEMAEIAARQSSAKKLADSLLRRKYVVPFLLACVILFCNTATGINSIIGFNTNILLQSGLSDLGAHWGYVLFTAVNFLATIVGMMLVDRKGRRFLLTLGTSGIVVSLIAVAALFWQTERSNIEARDAVQSMVEQPGHGLTLIYDKTVAARLLAASGYQDDGSLAPHSSLAIIYSFGGFTGATTFVRSDDLSSPIHIDRASSLPSGRIEAWFKNPFADLNAARSAPLKIERARIGRIPTLRHGMIVTLALFAFVAFFAVGPGVCVWLALSELMPTRIRSVGMSIALVINQAVSTTLAVVFLPIVSKYGYSSIFLLFAGFTVIYLVTAAFFLPETKGKTLEEMENYFEHRKAPLNAPAGR
ncbi:MAG: sugar porter family MFS transporter [Acidobacteriaceae bacterium]|nr:sugar porter family MFS transporter [Acidobacteriaceae bacterium]